MARLSNALHSIYTLFVIELESRRVHIVGSTIQTKPSCCKSCGS